MSRSTREGPLSQTQHYEIARRDIAALNEQFMALVTCPTNPMTREDLEANIKRRPALWSRFSGFLQTLPSRSELER